METTQAVLVPERALQPNRTYKLVLSRDATVPSTHPDWFRAMLGPVAWTTGPASDKTPPRWSARPEPRKAVYQQFGCGPDSYVSINVSFADAEPLLIRAEVRGAGKERPRRYLLEPFRGAIQIGREMCGGGFELASDQRYLVTLTAIDLAGNEAPAPGGPIEIVGPSPDDDLKRGERAGKMIEKPSPVRRRRRAALPPVIRRLDAETRASEARRWRGWWIRGWWSRRG